MQRARHNGQRYHQVLFLDLSKAYDTVDHARLIEILKGYGMGPRVLAILESAWKASRLAPKKGGMYGGTIHRNRGVQQGDPLSPTLFNLVIDAVVHHVSTTFEERDDGVTLLFYADDGRIGGTDPIGVQLRLSLVTEAFAAMGLKMNAVKTVSMCSLPQLRPVRQRHGARLRRAAGDGDDYASRNRRLVRCPHCDLELQACSLKRHITTQHPEADDPTNPDVWTPSPARPTIAVHRISHPDQTTIPILCPHPSCPPVVLPDRAATFRHWGMVHPEETLRIEEAPNHVKCPACDRMLGTITAEHRATQACKAGAQRKAARKRHLESRAPIPTFHVNGTNLTRVRRFRYLGRIISEDDSDLHAVARNIAKARTKWSQIAKVLQKDGASIAIFSRFYLIVVTTVLLYGCHTWAMTTQTWSMLRSFHQRCARHITKRFIRKNPETGDWITPETATTLRLALLQPIEFYVQNRRHNLHVRYTESREIYNECLALRQNASHSFPHYWTQPFELRIPLPVGGTPPGQNDREAAPS